LSNIDIRQGDGWLGLPNVALFNAIHVGAAAETLPKALVDQLAIGGCLVIPIGPQKGEQAIWSYVKQADGTLKKHKHFGVRYVPLMKV